MTGYGRGEISRNGLTAVAELRSVNSRFLEITTRLPRAYTLRENDVKEIVRKKTLRGNINVTVTIEHTNQNDAPLKINRSAAKAYYKLLNELRKSVRISKPVALEHLLQFSEVLEPEEVDKSDNGEWLVIEQALNQALDELRVMRKQEGAELKHDFEQRIQSIGQLLTEIEEESKQRIPEERERLRARVTKLLEDTSIIDDRRLELEIALLADKLDITEECVRFRSHNKLFLEALNNEEAAGRKLNFLLQEMNREANTIASKSYNAPIAHKAIAIKEELERLREQLQNIE